MTSTAQIAFTNQRGSALMIGLILLLALTILGVAGMNMARVELLMTQNSQFYTLASATAQSQVDVILNPNAMNLGTDLMNQALDSQLGAVPEGSWAMRSTGVGDVPVGSYSKQGGKFAARFYEFEADIDEYAIGTNLTLVQGAFIITPGE